MIGLKTILHKKLHNPLCSFLCINYFIAKSKGIILIAERFLAFLYRIIKTIIRLTETDNQNEPFEQCEACLASRL